MIKLPDKLPPSIVVILTLLIFCPISFIGGYFYAKESIGRNIAEATLDKVVEGEEQAAKIRRDRDNELEKVQAFKDGVKSGEIQISKDNYINPDIVNNWLRSIDEARP